MTSSLPASARLRSDAEIAGQIRCILSDVDGVLSDGRIVYAADSEGVRHELKSFHVRDGLGIKLWMRSGFDFGIITARESQVVAHRAKELGITNIAQASGDKWTTAQTMMKSFGVTPDQVCYIGDDLPDLPVMRKVGLAVAPDDGATDAREMAHWITRSAGGEGVLREVVERLLRATGQWNQHIMPEGD
ncbi:3-deoxy-D-manno-octulosonate 8-phosphate phosphatase (KDO 8-P phosphatase) [Neorhodopirellula lusitana]|uniref:3-deoxy-D-manno-octulosonate 8-phosphate phosphatase KdsC n=1 Tax=Neorhodopirellula lusitana TaxID=445327 RepID=A0ABY1PTB5_9BACT|nr:HAD-IIIA family hydrolase [Neorhodopirellula lusitana]SMP46808.1 3-deoxy-D-manno-octulosonate 8-phosphate phosphatase (KDO 8-P phosphatase) [Neorhodopirellula lusitana]